MKLHNIAFILLVIGGLNWLAIGVFSWGISEVLGDQISRVVYVLVGLAAVYEVVTHKANCRNCSTAPVA